MLREMAAGVGVSYESLSRDYSQSNYSSSRLALLDERSLWRVLQGWLIRDHLTPIYRAWLDAADHEIPGKGDVPIRFVSFFIFQFRPKSILASACTVTATTQKKIARSTGIAKKSSFRSTVM